MSPPRIPSFAAGRLGRKVTPWVAYYKVARQVMDRAVGGWSALTPNERSDLVRILKDSHGRPAAVSRVDRERIRNLMMKAGKGAARPKK